MGTAMTPKQRRERTVSAELSCRHRRDYKHMYAPDVGEQLWCFSCHTMETVLHVRDEYRVKCRGCRFTRRKGQEKLGAEILAGKHHRLNPGHLVELWYGVELRHEWKPQNEKLFTETLHGKPLETLELPPF